MISALKQRVAAAPQPNPCALVWRPTSKWRALLATSSPHHKPASTQSPKAPTAKKSARPQPANQEIGKPFAHLARYAVVLGIARIAPRNPTTPPPNPPTSLSPAFTLTRPRPVSRALRPDHPTELPDTNPKRQRGNRLRRKPGLHTLYSVPARPRRPTSPPIRHRRLTVVGWRISNLPVEAAGYQSRLYEFRMNCGLHKCSRNRSPIVQEHCSHRSAEK
jgi:hypothetical protein